MRCREVEEVYLLGMVIYLALLLVSTLVMMAWMVAKTP